MKTMKDNSKMSSSSSRTLYVKYVGDPIKALEAALRQHGDDVALIMVPEALWNRLVGKNGRRLSNAA